MHATLLEVIAWVTVCCVVVGAMVLGALSGHMVPSTRDVAQTQARIAPVRPSVPATNAQAPAVQTVAWRDARTGEQLADRQPAR